MEKEIAIIVAKSINNVIGKVGMIPWLLPPDLKHFKQITTGYPVVMGTKTYNSLPRILPNRLNVVVSNTLSNLQENVLLVRNIKDILYLDTPKIFYIGGQRVYEEAINICNKLYITQILHVVEGDTYFPDIDLNKWKLDKISETLEYELDEFSAIKYRFEEYILK